MTEVLVMVAVCLNCVIVKTFNAARTRFTSFAFALQQEFAEWWLTAESPLMGVLTGSKKQNKKHETKLSQK
jgi:hypothetical protein